MKPKLAILTLDFYPVSGGVQQYIVEIIKRLAVSFDVTILTPETTPELEGTRFDQINIRNGGLLAFAKNIRACSPDYLLLGHAHPRMLLAARLAGYAYGTIIHGNDFLAAQVRWHRLLFNHLVRQSDPLISNSKRTAERFMELGLPKPKIIHPGVDIERFSPTIPKKRPGLTILSVGRLVRRKGIDLVIESLPDILKKYPDLAYRVAGTGPDHDRLENLAAAFRVSHAVKFLGHVEDEDLPTEYRNADIFILPVLEDQTDIEGFGLVFLEASASGLAIIAGRSGGAPEAVLDGKTGILIEPGDSSALAAAILDLIDNPDKRESLGSAGRQWVVNEMSWDRTAQKIASTLLRT